MEQPLPKVPPDVKAAVQLHDLRSTSFVHTNLQSHDCGCRQTSAAPRNGAEPVSRGVVAQQPRQFTHDTGETCLTCGGLTVRTGTCTTCTSCGSTSGCG